MKNQIRHGDVQIQECAEPAVLGERIAPHPERGVLLALGEATGHAHAIADADAVEFYDVPENDNSGVRWLKVLRPTMLRHEEHEGRLLNPGWHRIGIKRQYSEDEQGWSPVID